MARGHWVYWQRYVSCCVGVLHQMEKKVSTVHQWLAHVFQRDGTWVHFDAQAWEDWTRLGEKTSLLDFFVALQGLHINLLSLFRNSSITSLRVPWSLHLSYQTNLWSATSTEPQSLQFKGPIAAHLLASAMPSVIILGSQRGRGEKSLFPIQVNRK